MKKFLSIPRLANAPSELIEHGSLRIQEKVDGANFRFQLCDSGVIRFGDRSRVYAAQEIPVTFDAVYDRTLEDIIREEHKQLYYGNTDVDMKVFRSEVAALTRQFLESNLSAG